MAGIFGTNDLPLILPPKSGEFHHSDGPPLLICLAMVLIFASADVVHSASEILNYYGLVDNSFFLGYYEEVQT